MPVLIFLGILLVYAVAEIYDTAMKSDCVFTKEEHEEMLKLMCGKSKKECWRIRKEFERRKKYNERNL